MTVVDRHQSIHARRLRPPFRLAQCPVFGMSAANQDETSVYREGDSQRQPDRRLGRESTSPTVRVRSGCLPRSPRRYDFLNHLLSLNIDRSWRQFTTRVVAPEPGMPVLDCCTGTADLALAYDRAGRGRSPIVGTDFCREMLVLGQAKVRKASADRRVTLVEGDAQRLPVPSDTFGVVSVAFGLRNVRDTVRGIDELIRVARPGGKVAILEFSRPRGGFWARSTWRFSAICCRGSDRPWPRTRTVPTTILPRSVLEFPDGQAMLDLLASRGLTELQLHPLTFGIATLYVGTKPAGTGVPVSEEHGQ